MTPIIPLQHSEHLSKAFYTLTIDPLLDIFYYFVPFMGAWFSGYRPLMLDPSQEALMPQEQTKKIAGEITNLTRAANLYRQVVPYVGLNHSFGSSGGNFSLSTPVLLIPDQALFRRSPLPCFNSNPNYSGDTWHFSDDEVRFFLARELVQIGLNSSLLRIIIKIAVVTAIIGVFTLPMSTMAANAILASSFGIYLFTERLFQQTSDRSAISILKKIGVQNPVQVAIGALNKLRDQNLLCRENSNLAKLYISTKGENYLDFLHPPLQKRVEHLKKLIS